MSLVQGAEEVSPTHDSNTTALRLDTIERELPNKVSRAEHDLQIQNIKEAYSRVENAINKLVVQVDLLQDKIADLELKAEQRSSEHSKALANIQLRLFYGILSIIGIVIGGYLVWYFTNPH